MSDWRTWGRVAEPAPREGDEFTTARAIINAARLVMPAGASRPRLTGAESTQEAREVIVAFLREHGVPLPPGPLPTKRGWLDCFTGQVVDPGETDGRKFV